MISGGNSLTYNLYTSNTYGTVWGTAVANLVSGTGNGAAQALTVYGQILSGQFSAPGSYSDTVTATVNY